MNKTPFPFLFLLISCLCALSPGVSTGLTNSAPVTAINRWISSLPNSDREQLGEVTPIAVFTNETVAAVAILQRDKEGNTRHLGQCVAAEGGEWKVYPRALTIVLGKEGGLSDRQRKKIGLTEEQLQSLAKPVAQCNEFLKYRDCPWSAVKVVPGNGTPAGVWENGRDGFYQQSIAFRSDGEGFLGVAVAGIPFRWRTNNNDLVLTLDDGRTTTNVLARFEADKDVIVLLRKGKEDPFWRVSTDEPPSLEELRKGVSPTTR